MEATMEATMEAIMTQDNWLPYEDRLEVKVAGVGYYCFKKSGTGTKLVKFNPNLMKRV